jgi:lysophospholipase L1-like esterase
MKNLAKLSLGLFAALAIAMPAAAQVDLTRYVALGDSLTHGYMNGCVVKYGQNDSYSAVVARSVGANYQQPLIDDPGLGGCQLLTSLAPTFSVKPSTGKPLNSTLATPYNNLGVAGYKVADVVNKTGDTPAGLTDTVLRGQGTALAQAVKLAPTFVTVWIGNNDELGAMTSAIVIDGVTLTPRAAFKASYETILKSLQAAQGGTAKGVVFTLPDVATIPFSTTLPIYNITLGAPVIHKSGAYAGTPWRWTGSRDGKEIPFGSLVPLTASAKISAGYGVACGMLDDAGYPATGPLRAACDKLPLAEGTVTAAGAQQGYVVYADNVAKIQARTAEFNADIASLAATYGFKVFDIAATFNDIVKNGRNYGGIGLTTAYLQGGFFGFDGVHGTTIGYAVIADEFVQFLNANYNAGLHRPDLSSILFSANTTGGWFPNGLGAFIGDPLNFAASYWTPENTEALFNAFGARYSHPSVGTDGDVPVPHTRPVVEAQ